jgi:hypothetical protein
MRQRATTADAAREEALRAYIAQMSDVMLDRSTRRGQTTTCVTWQERSR